MARGVLSGFSTEDNDVSYLWTSWLSDSLRSPNSRGACARRLLQRGTSVDAVLAAHSTRSLVCCPRPTYLYLTVRNQSCAPGLQTHIEHAHFTSHGSTPEHVLFIISRHSSNTTPTSLSVAQHNALALYQKLFTLRHLPVNVKNIVLLKTIPIKESNRRYTRHDQHEPHAWSRDVLSAHPDSQISLMCFSWTGLFTSQTFWARCTATYAYHIRAPIQFLIQENGPTFTANPDTITLTLPTLPVKYLKSFELERVISYATEDEDTAA